MYDASLDQFQPHSWSIPFITRSEFHGNGWDANVSFSTVRSVETSTTIPNKYFHKRYPDIDVHLTKASQENIRRMQGKKGIRAEEKIMKGLLQLLPLIQISEVSFLMHHCKRW
jgi:hypothetical protein